MATETVDVAIIGAGPAGLAAAMELKRHGVRRVLVVEREYEAGGVPRHCGHPPFGWREYGRILTGPRYAARLRQDVARLGVEVRLRTTLVKLGESGALDLATSSGLKRISARRVILATGGRETPRAARLIGGSRPLGVLTTGALQSMVYLRGRKPFERPLIVGTELVSFSAVLTCRKAGIKPIAMVDEGQSPVAPWPCAWYPRLIGMPLWSSTTVERIEGRERVERVVLKHLDGGTTAIACDGVIFTGRFVPEASLLSMSHLAIDQATGGPVVDQNGRCSDPAYFAAGNLLRPIETAGWSFWEGQAIGAIAAQDITSGTTKGSREVLISPRLPVRLVMPQKLSLPMIVGGLSALQVRVDRPVKGDLQIVSGGVPIWRQRMSAFPERRLLVPLDAFVARVGSDGLTVEFRERAA